MGQKHYEQVRYSAPSAWASYLINGDGSGLSYEDRQDALKFVAGVGLGDSVDCDDIGFEHACDAEKWCGGLPADDMCNYIFLRRY